MGVNVTDWDASEYLESEEDVAAYLNDVLEEGDPALLQAALGDVAKIRGMTNIARDAGVCREGLYRSLRTSGNPSFQTIWKVTHALGLKLSFVPATGTRPSAPSFNWVECEGGSMTDR